MSGIGIGMARAQRQKPLSVFLEDLSDKWTSVSEDHPVCAACGLRIEGMDEFDQHIIPVRLFSEATGRELALHPQCFGARIAR